MTGCCFGSRWGERRPGAILLLFKPRLELRSHACLLLLLADLDSHRGGSGPGPWTLASFSDGAPGSGPRSGRVSTFSGPGGSDGATGEATGVCSTGDSGSTIFSVGATACGAGSGMISTGTCDTASTCGTETWPTSTPGWSARTGTVSWVTPTSAASKTGLDLLALQAQTCTTASSPKSRPISAYAAWEFER